MNMEDADDLYEVLSDESVMKYIERPFDMKVTKELIKYAKYLGGTMRNRFEKCYAFSSLTMRFLRMFRN